ncbi:DsbA family protein [Brachybacterium alimentarium]|uniref:DsbA family protein n=1 Tax=Brachybacterium alimentarium TaxID=47845 RepID=UPI003FBA19C1
MTGANSSESEPGTGRQLPPRRRFLVPAVIIVVVALLIAAVLWLRPGGEQGGGDTVSTAGSSVDVSDLPPPSEVAVPDLSDAESRDPEDLLADGPVDAPVVLVVFTDYQCPYCARWTHDTLPALQDYVERGELRIEWRDVNVYGEDSVRAARAALAAAMQGRHADYQQALFDGGEIRSSSQLSDEALIELADDLGLDPVQFAEDMQSEQVGSTIVDNAARGIELGAMTTPSFVIGGTPSVGAQPTEVFTDQIDEALEEADA